MATRIKLRSDTAANWAAANAILAAGEIGLVIEGALRRAKVGDGATAWNALEWAFEEAGGGGGATAFADLTDKATANLPEINTPLASALAGKETAGAAATAQAYSIQRANHTGTQAQSTIVNLVSDLAGKAGLAGNNTFTGQQEFTDASTFLYTATSRGNHLSSLGAGTTGAELFGAATAVAANSTLGTIRGAASADVTATTQNFYVNVASVELTAGTWRVQAFYYGSNSSSNTVVRLSSSSWSDTNGRRIATVTGASVFSGPTFQTGGTSSPQNFGSAAVAGEIIAVVMMTSDGTLSMQFTNSLPAGTVTGFSGSHIIAIKL